MPLGKRPTDVIGKYGFESYLCDLNLKIDSFLYGSKFLVFFILKCKCLKKINLLYKIYIYKLQCGAGEARWAHNPKDIGSKPITAKDL